MRSRSIDIVFVIGIKVSPEVLITVLLDSLRMVLNEASWDEP